MGNFFFSLMYVSSINVGHICLKKIVYVKFKPNCLSCVSSCNYRCGGWGGTGISHGMIWGVGLTEKVVFEQGFEVLEPAVWIWEGGEFLVRGCAGYI